MQLKTLDGRKSNNAAQGFTLIELCIVIIISGLIFTSLFQVYTGYLNQQKITVTRDNMVADNAAISGFFGRKARYPCPADRALQSNDANFGKEANNGLCTPAALGIPIGTCNASGGLCVTAAPAGRAPFGDSRDAVIIGTLPIAALTNTSSSHISNDIAFDGWNRQYLYAVTVGLTDVASFTFNNGTINAVDENNLPTAGIAQDAHYVIISHGPDGNGAWSKEGKRYSACGTLAQAKDNENCNDDSTFMEAIINSSVANVGAHFDDYAFFLKSQSALIWALQSGTNNMYNLNTGVTAVGTATPNSLGTEPAAALDVEDPLGAGNGVLRAVNTTPASPNGTITKQICRRDGTHCFLISAITTGIGTCSGGNIMNGLQTTGGGVLTAGTTAPVCNGTNFHPIRPGTCPAGTSPPGCPNAPCPAGQWINAIDSNGYTYCK